MQSVHNISSSTVYFRGSSLSSDLELQGPDFHSGLHSHVHVSKPRQLSALYFRANVLHRFSLCRRDECCLQGQLKRNDGECCTVHFDNNYTYIQTYRKKKYSISQIGFQNQEGTVSKRIDLNGVFFITRTVL